MKRHRLLFWLSFAILLYALLCCVGGISVADGALHPAKRSLLKADSEDSLKQLEGLGATVDNVSLSAPDAAVLRAWLIRPSQPNGNAVITLHGLADNRLGMTGYAAFLVARGFSVLLPDARAHGESGGAIATYGLLEQNDIRRWVDFLRTETDSGCVYGLGESMGAAELLQSLAAGASFCAVVAESPFSNFREIAYDRMGQPFRLGPWIGRTLLRPLVEVAFLRARWKYGLNMEQVSPEDAVVHSRIPVLLIHGQLDSNIPVRHSRRIHALAPRTHLWEVPSAEHCGAIAAEPKEFERKLVNWFQVPSRP